MTSLIPNIDENQKHRHFSHTPTSPSSASKAHPREGTIRTHPRAKSKYTCSSAGHTQASPRMQARLGTAPKIRQGISGWKLPTLNTDTFISRTARPSKPREKIKRTTEISRDFVSLLFPLPSAPLLSTSRKAAKIIPRDLRQKQRRQHKR